MSRLRPLTVMVSCALLLAATLAVPLARSMGVVADDGVPEAVEDVYSRLPVWFEANAGQAGPEVDFVARAGGERVLLTGDGPIFDGAGDGGPVRFDLVGAGPVEATGLAPQPGRSNYLLGDDPAAWHLAVPHFGRVAYRGVWPGVDLLYRGRGQALEYDFVVAPGADPATIVVAVQGAGGPLSIDRHGDLVVPAGEAPLRQSRPVLYQRVEGRRQAVEGSFTLLGPDRFGFRVGDYNRSRPLVIDPVVSWSTALGGILADSVASVAVDGAGNTYLTGSTGSANFPVANALQPARNGALADAFVTKLNPAGTALVWSTYVGGTAADEGTGIAVDGAGNATVAGVAASTDFPVVNAAQGTKGAGATSDAFVLRLNAAGSALSYSTFLGGGLADSARGVALAPDGTAFVAGTTASSGATAFPTVTPFQATLGGATDAFVAHLDPSQTGAASLLSSTYLGGSAEELGSAVAVDTAGSAYVTGETRSANFPTTGGALKTTISGACPTGASPGRLCREAFVTKLAPAGTSLAYSTYLGGTTSTFPLEIGEAGLGIDVDTAGAAYVVGETSSDDFPTVGAVQSSRGGAFDGFATKLNAAGSAIAYSTYLGGVGSDAANAVAVDDAGSAHITGSGSATYPRVLPIAPANGNGDAVVTQLSPTGSSIVHSSHLGGTSGDTGRGIAVDGSGTEYVGGNSFSSNFPTLAGFQGTPGGGNDGFVARIAPGPASGPLVTGVAPRSGPAAGGTPVVITGTGLDGATGVSFGGVPATQFEISSPTRIVAVTPGGSGVDDVTVTTAGGSSPPNPVAEFTYAEGLWSPTGPQTRVRFTPTLTLMAGGKVLLAGGRAESNGPALASAEIYDPLTDTWTATGSMGVPRFSHTATLLRDGKVLVTGGFDLQTPVFTTAGGLTNTGPVQASAEVFDPATGAWSPVGSMAVNRAIHTATRLPDGRVLVAGGRSCPSPSPAPCESARFTNRAELFDPAAGTFSPTGAMDYGRHTHDAVLLASGKVLAAGGFGSAGDHITDPVPGASQLNLAVSEIYDPGTGTWTRTGDLNAGRARHDLVRLLDNRVAAVAGFPASTSLEIYDPGTGAWSVSEPLPLSRSGQCSVLLPTGDLLSNLPASYPTDLFDPRNPGWRSAGLTTASHSCTSGVTTMDAVVISSDPDTFEADPAVCGANCGKALLAGDSDQPVGDLYTHKPVVTGVRTVESPWGTTAVVIEGLGLTGASEVRIDGVLSPEVTVESYNRVTAIVPPGAVGSSEVTVLTPGGRSEPVSVTVTQVKGAGYWLTASDGGIFTFGDAEFHGSTGDMVLNRPVVGMAPTRSGRGYWLVASDGGIFTFGDAGFHGSTGDMVLNKPIVGMAPTPSGNGYWLVASDGGIFSFGDADFYGSTGALALNQPVVGMTPTASGRGYWMVAADGGIFTFGDADFHGSTGDIALNRPIVGMATTPSGRGYWLVAADGGIFTFGDAEFLGSTGALVLNKPVVGMAPTPTGEGYWLVATDGGIFTFGDAPYFGSTGDLVLNQPVVGMAARFARIGA